MKIITRLIDKLFMHYYGAPIAPMLPICHRHFHHSGLGRCSDCGRTIEFIPAVQP